MGPIPSSVAAVLSKLPQLDSNQISSLEGFLKLTGLKFDETTNKYKINPSFDSNFNADDELILISEIINRFITYERERNIIGNAKEKYQRVKYELIENANKRYTKMLEKEKLQLKKTVRQLQSKIQRRDKLIAPKPISNATTHRLTVTKMKKKPNMYRLGRVQKRNVKRRLTQIAKEEGLTYEEVRNDETRTKIIKAPPHAIDSASSLRDFLKNHNFKVDGRTQKIEWKGSLEELHNLITLFNNREESNKLPEAERILKMKLITDYFPPVDQ